MTDDDRAVMERLAALEAEVKADADAQRARKEAALAKVREERAKQQVERDDLRKRQAELVTKKKQPEPERALVKRGRSSDDDDSFDTGSIGGALELAGRANKVKQELAKRPEKGQKSWVKSGIASMALGPIGWLYAGSLRESIPASAAWLAVLSLASKILPSILLMPVLFVVLPLSGIAGIVYALQYNRHGKRQRLFDREKPKQLPRGND